MKGFTRPLLRVRFYLALMLCAFGLSASAQYLPTFSGVGTQNGKIPGIALNGSPGTAGDPNYLYIAYSDANNSGYLTLAVSSDGVNYTRYTSSISMNSDPAIAADGGGNVYIAYINNYLTVNVLQWTPSGGFGTITAYSPDVTGYANKPALLYTTLNGTPYLYLAWEGQAYDPDTGTYDGEWINTAYSTNGGINFTPSIQMPNYYGYTGPVTESYEANSGPSMALYNGSIYLSYIDSENADPHMFTTSVGSTTFTEQGLPPGIYAGDPSIFTWQNILYEGYRSYYSEDNLWMTLGYGSYTNPTMYGQTLTYDPGFAVVGTPASNILYQTERTNYPGSGAYLWVFESTYATTQPAPEDQLPESPGGGSGGGGGGRGGGGGGHCGDAMTSAAMLSPGVRPACPIERNTALRSHLDERTGVQASPCTPAFLF